MFRHRSAAPAGCTGNDAVRSLTYTPTEETRNRKPLEQPAPFEASWELRCGPENRFRVFYSMDPGAVEVWVLAVGIKDRKRLIIGGEEYES